MNRRTSSNSGRGTTLVCSHFAAVAAPAPRSMLLDNHHAMIDHLRALDRPFLALNLFMLLWIGLIPWPTRLVAEYMRDGGFGERVASLVYAGTMTMMGVAFGLLWT